MSKSPSIYLTKNEYAVIQLALGRLMDELKSNNIALLPWNSESRKDMKAILAAANSTAIKIEKVTGIKATLPDYVDGEESDYLTKES